MKTSRVRKNPFCFHPTCQTQACTNNSAIDRCGGGIFPTSSLAHPSHSPMGIFHGKTHQIWAEIEAEAIFSYEKKMYIYIYPKKDWVGYPFVKKNDLLYVFMWFLPIFQLQTNWRFTKVNRFAATSHQCEPLMIWCFFVSWNSTKFWGNF